MDPATVLFVGRKERYKGYHALRDAAKIVWRSRPEARFVAIGQNAWTARFERRFNDDRWIDRGIVSEAEKAEAYARATIFAMPSIHETFGHTYLEAWYAWRPVIAGDIPALREMVREGIDGLVVAQEPRRDRASDPHPARRHDPRPPHGRVGPLPASGKVDVGPRRGADRARLRSRAGTSRQPIESVHPSA